MVEKLQTRYGSENKSEVFRTQLKTRTRSKTESISELAHAVKKMTRRAYPTGSPDVIESLAIDNYIDALNDSEIRLRLREVSPKNLSEAEKIAIRMEAHRLADRQRSKLIGSVGESCKEDGKEQNSPNSQDSSNPQNNYYKGPNQYNRSYPQPNGYNHNPNFRYNNTGNQRFQNRTYNNNNGPRYNNYPRNGNDYTFGTQFHYPNHNVPHRSQNRNQSSPGPHQFRASENYQVSSWRDRNSINQTGPKLH